jgi:hypothetical protein
MTKDQIYSDFLALGGMNAPLGTKCRMLGWLLKHGPNWLVVGITPAALETLAGLGFKYVPRNGLERAHPHSRASTYSRLISELPLQGEFWRILNKYDRAILCNNAAPDKENARIAALPFYQVPSGLFMDRGGVGWKHGIAERDFLADLYEHRNNAPLVTWEQLSTYD